MGGSFVNPSGIAIAANGDTLVNNFTSANLGGGIIRVDPGTGAQTVLSSAGSFGTPYGITIVPAQAVPEPSVLALLGSGLAGLAAVAWKRGRRP